MNAQGVSMSDDQPKRVVPVAVEPHQRFCPVCREEVIVQSIGVNRVVCPSGHSLPIESPQRQEER